MACRSQPLVAGVGGMALDASGTTAVWGWGRAGLLGLNNLKSPMVDYSILIDDDDGVSPLKVIYQ